MSFAVVGFVFELLLFAALTFVLYVQTSTQENRITTTWRPRAFLIASVCTELLIVLSALDLLGLLDFGGYRYLSVACALFGAVTTAFVRWSDKIPASLTRVVRFALRSLTVCLALELFVFNFHSAHLFLGDYPQGTLEMSTATVTNFDADDGTNEGSGSAVIEFQDINVPIGTLTIDAESNKMGFVNLSISMSDETHSASYRNNIASAQVLQDNTRSQTVPCNFSGTVYDLKLSFNAAEGETITIRRIAVNEPILFSFSFVRCGLLFVGSLIGYALVASVFLRRSLSDNRRGVKLVAYAMTAVLLVTALWLSNISRVTDPDHSLQKDFSMTSGNQITQSIVDAFADGRTTMDIPMNEKLEALENPYDGSQREAGQIGAYPWDHLYYDGAYYSYYGIGPVLVLFLPYHLITGYYFPSVWAVWLFGALGIVFLTKTYLCFMEKFFPKTRSSLILLGLFIMQLSTGIWFCFHVPNFYEIAQTSGFACVTAGAFFMISSNVIGDGAIKNWRLVLAALFLSLAVLCRPTLAVYCVAALLFIYAGFQKKRTLYTRQNGGKLTYYLPYLACALLPFAVIGSVQMLYNYARFGSFTDFGIQYSLTINDFTSAQFHTHFSTIGFFNYLLAIPNFIARFPFFVGGNVQTFDPQGYYFIATGTAVGLVWKALPVLSYGKSLKAYRLAQDANKKLYTLLIVAVCIACPFAIIFSIWESGYGARYCVDFAWQILIGAYIVAFIVYEHARENTRAHLNTLMVAAAVVCLVLNVGQIYSWIAPESIAAPAWQSDVLSFARLFEFWR